MRLLIGEIAAIDILPVPGPSQIDVELLDRGDALVYFDDFDAPFSAYQFSHSREGERECACSVD